ncbi:MAG: class I SAM-dependent methyltransferase [Pseudomonadota bacterium]
MLDNHYTHPRLAAIYDASRRWREDFDFYLALARSKPMRVMELGCGTGLLSRAYARDGHDVTGVDPAASMLAVAKTEPHGDSVAWVNAFAQTYRSDRQFDLIVMTGHAFQVLMTDVDMLMAFAALRTHLAPGGTAVFESRNPGFDWAEVWDEETIIRHGGQEIGHSVKLSSFADERLTFEMRYRFSDTELVSNSVLRFPTNDHVVRGLEASGLQVEAVLGDWLGGPFHAKTSREMIFKVRASDR